MRGGCFILRLEWGMNLLSVPEGGVLVVEA